MHQQEFVELLQSLLLPNTERVQAATAALKRDYYKSADSLPALLQILGSNENKALRQLAAVEARKLVSKHWASLPEQQKPQIRNQLLQSIISEEVTLVRHSSARVIAAIANIDLGDEQWADLPQTLYQAASSNVPRHREVAVYILATLLETTGHIFCEDVNKLFRLLSVTINDPDSVEVRISTMMALGRTAIMLDPDDDEESLAAFNSVLPNMIEVLRVTIMSGDEDQSMQVFEVFQTLLACDSALLKLHMESLVNFMNSISANPEIDDDARSQALAFLMQCVRYRPLGIQAKRLGEGLALTALHIVTELGDLSSEDYELTPARSALGLLDALSQHMPPNQVIVPLLHAMGGYVNSENPDFRRAGILALGACAEGVPDFINSQLGEIVPLVLRLLRDPEARVRAAALNTLARLADELADEIANDHARIIPALVTNLDSAVDAGQGPQAELALEVVRGSCSAIGSLVEGLTEDDASGYVHELVPRFINLFGALDFRSQVASVDAVGSVAAVAGQSFLPFFHIIMRSLVVFVQLKGSQNDLYLRGVACDAISKIACAVGPEAFREYVDGLMQASHEALDLVHSRLRETSYTCWSTIAKVYKEEFEAFLPGVVEGLLKCLQQPETDVKIPIGKESKDLIGKEITFAGSNIQLVDSINDDNDDGDDDGKDEDEAWDRLGTVTAVAMEKEIAIEVVADVISATRNHYLPYIARSIDTILPMVDHPYEGIRKAAISTLWRAYATFWGIAEEAGMAKWKSGLPLRVQPPNHLQELGHQIMKVTINMLEDEMDRSTVTDVCRDLGAALKRTGPAVLITQGGNVVKQLTRCLVAILSKIHPCQHGLGEDSDDDLDELSENDWVVIEVTLDCMTCLSAALGESFAEIWKDFEKPVIVYASGQEAIVRSNSVGSIADCIENMGSAVTPHTATLMKILLHRLSDEYAETRSNATYGIGILCEKSNDVHGVIGNYPFIITELELMLHGQQQTRILDNAAGCISRMIMRHPENVPLHQILPRLVEALPLREDFDENEPVYTMLIKLYSVQEPRIQQLMQHLTARLIPVFENVLASRDDELRLETKQELACLVQRLRS